MAHEIAQRPLQEEQNDEGQCEPLRGSDKAADQAIETLQQACHPSGRRALRWSPAPQLALMWPIRGAVWPSRTSTKRAIDDDHTAPALAAPGEVAAPTIVAEGRIALLLPPQFDHQAKCVFHRRLFDGLAGSLLGSCH